MMMVMEESQELLEYGCIQQIEGSSGRMCVMRLEYDG